MLVSVILADSYLNKSFSQAFFPPTGSTSPDVIKTGSSLEIPSQFLLIAIEWIILKKSLYAFAVKVKPQSLSFTYLSTAFSSLESQSSGVLLGANALLFEPKVKLSRSLLLYLSPLVLHISDESIIPILAAESGIKPVPIITAPSSSTLYLVKNTLVKNEPIL